MKNIRLLHIRPNFVHLRCSRAFYPGLLYVIARVSRASKVNPHPASLTVSLCRHLTLLTGLHQLSTNPFCFRLVFYLAAVAVSCSKLPISAGHNKQVFPGWPAPLTFEQRANPAQAPSTISTAFHSEDSLKLLRNLGSRVRLSSF